MNLDKIRELDKVLLALTHAINYHEFINRANAILHSSEKVLYSPLTVELNNALAAAMKVRNELHDEDKAAGAY